MIIACLLIIFFVLLYYQIQIEKVILKSKANVLKLESQARNETEQIKDKATREINQIKEQERMNKKPPQVIYKEVIKGADRPSDLRPFLKELIEEEISEISKYSSSSYCKKPIVKSIFPELNEPLQRYLCYIPDSIDVSSLIQYFRESSPKASIIKEFERIRENIKNINKQEEFNQKNNIANIRKDAAVNVLGNWYNKYKSFIVANKNNYPALFSHFTTNSREKDISYDRFVQLFKTMNG